MVAAVRGKALMEKAASQPRAKRAQAKVAPQKVMHKVFERTLSSNLVATVDGDLVLQLQGNPEQDFERVVENVKRRGKLLKVTTPGGKTFQFSIREGEALSRDSELQRLVDASESQENKAAAIEARMRTKAVEMVMGGTSWFTASDLFAELAKKPSNVHTVASRWLEQGRIFALEKNGVRIYPRYAFDAMVEPVPILREVLKVLQGRSPFQVAAWFESTSTYLGGKRPREVLEQDGLAVVMAAQRMMEGAVHG